MKHNKRRNKKSPKIRPLAVQHDSQSPTAEQYRTIRTNIQFASVDHEMRTLMVTSAAPEEGKTTTVANLAAAMAQQGKKTLLIDADMRKPTLHYMFRADNTIGFTNVLTHQSEFEAAVASTEEENLDVLTSGPIPPNPAELLSSNAMDETLKQALQIYDTVLLDTPPVLAVTDAQVMSNFCDGTILVVTSGKTDNEAAQKAKDLLEKSQAKLLGVVLNRKPEKKSHYYYYYGTS